jgi:two-component system, response regulator PhcR
MSEQGQKLMNKPDEAIRYSILYVDDEEMALKYFSQTFSKDFNVITSNSVASARKILDEQNDDIAVLLTDQRMPNETGVDLLKYARKEYPHIIRLLTTAYTDINDAIDAVNTGGIYRYITKPWDIKNLNEQLYNAFYLYHAKRFDQDLLKEKRLAMFQLAGNIAHELRTPILTIKSLASGVTNYLPRLIEAYQKAKEQKVSIPEIRTPHQQKLQNAVVDIINEAQHSLSVIDMLMVNATNEKNDPDSYTNYSMRECIKETLHRYIIKEDQKEKITFEDDTDFLSRGSSTLMTHVFFNLLKNALYAIAANENKGTIHIRMESGDKYNLICFRDTATGIDSHALPYIFEDFYSTKKSGAGSNIGLGLAFCKNTLTNFGGSIECNTEPGSFTEFILKLPVISEQEAHIT